MLCEYGVENLHSPAFKLDISTNFTQTRKAFSLQLCSCKFYFITQERGNLSLPWCNLTYLFLRGRRATGNSLSSDPARNFFLACWRREREKKSEQKSCSHVSWQNTTFYERPGFQVSQCDYDAFRRGFFAHITFLGCKNIFSPRPSTILL